MASIRLGWIVCLVALLGAGSRMAFASPPGSAGNVATPASAPASLTFEHGFPSKETSSWLMNERRLQQAIQTYYWAMPAMSLYSMRAAQQRQFGDGANVMAIWKDRINAKTVVLTANPDVIYAFAWLDLKRDGPTVVEAPAGLQGLMDDMWHRPITDVGAAGPDQGKGGKFLLLPPGFDGTAPPGYYALKSPTNGVFVFWRAFLEKGSTAPGVALIEKTRIYPLAQERSPPKMSFPNASGVPMNMLFPTDHTFFSNLATFIDAEPADEADFAMRGLAAGIGIVKGQPYRPDSQTKAMLDRAAQLASDTARALALRTPQQAPDSRIYTDRMWLRMFGVDNASFLGPTIKAPTYLDWEARTHFFQDAYGTSPAMVVAMVGKGSQYLGGTTDADGDYLDGSKAYRVHIPANVPAANYWSYVLYDSETRSLLDNGEPFPSIASNTGVRLNEDGSADVYFGPSPPKDGNPNWIKTVPGRGYVGGLRLYSPTQPFFDKSWKPGNIEKVR